jgi:hypothetical protein
MSLVSGCCVRPVSVLVLCVRNKKEKDMNLNHTHTDYFIIISNISKLYNSDVGQFIVIKIYQVKFRLNSLY